MMNGSEPTKGSGRTRTLWGVAPVAPIHFGFDPMLVSLRAEDGERKIVLADSHVLQLQRANAAEVAKRTAYYRSYLFHCSGLAPSIVPTSDFVTNRDYVEVLYDLLAKISIARTRRAQPAAMKNNASSEKLISLVSLVMQCADVLYLKADLVVADPSQRRVYDLLGALETAQPPGKIPKLSYCPPACDIRGEHIFDSTSATRIAIHDGPDDVNRKVAKMYAPPPGQPLEPGRVHAMHEYFRWSVFPWRDRSLALRAEDGGKVEVAQFSDYLALYESGRLHPRECKMALAQALNERIAEISVRMDKATWIWVKQTPPAARTAPHARQATIGALS
jgi:tyrosyl-tRNA synthetase